MTNVIFCGVGGQGVILASKVLMQTALNAGFDVKESEVHGMAQRGGSVECNVRFGEKIFSPLIGTGASDYIVALELLEGVRKLDFLKKEGRLIVNRFKIDPVPVQQGAMSYPVTIEPWLKETVPGFVPVDTEATLKELGNAKALNIVMLGVLSRFLPFTQEQWESAIRECVKEKFIELNLAAFNAGKNL